MLGTEPHYVDSDKIEAAYFYCIECMEEVESDGDGWWHKDPALNPVEDEEVK